MPTASSGRPGRSGSHPAKPAKANLSKDDERALEDGVVDDEITVDASDDDLVDDTLVADARDDLDDADEDDGDDRAVSGTTLTKKRTKAAASTTTKTRSASKSKADRGRRPGRERSGNPFANIVRFIREVIGEMRKVLWPSRRELIVYTIAVIVFVTVMISIVGGLDFGFARLILLIFG